MPSEPTNPPDSEDEIEVEEEDEDEEEEETEPEPAPPPPPTPPTPPRRARAAPRRARAARGVGAASHDVEVLWPWLLRKGLADRGLAPWDIDILVKRIDPNECVLGSINGQAVQGSSSESAADALIRYVDDVYHMPNCRGPGTYQLFFNSKRTNLTITRGRLIRPDMEEIERTRAARHRNMRQVPARGGMGGQPYEQPPTYDQWGRPQNVQPNFGPPPGYGPPQGYGAPPYGYPAPPGYGAGWPPAPYGYQAPPQPAPPDPAMTQYMAHQQKMIDGLLGWIKEQGMSLPAGLAAPPPPPPTPQVPVPSPQQAKGFLSDAQQLVSAIKALRGLGKEIDQVFSSETPGGEGPATVEPSSPEESSYVQEIGGFKMVKDRATGATNWGETLLGNMENPTVQKVVDTAQKIAEAAAKSAGVKDGTIEAITGSLRPPAQQLPPGQQNGAAGVGQPAQQQPPQGGWPQV